MDKVYDHSKVEDKWYEFWEKEGYFKPKIDSKKRPFSIIMPPPNANGTLHIGHAMYVVEDILVRWHRMMGDSTLWLPGSDHAGIMTQVVYEKELAKKGKTRFDLGQEKFFKEVYDFTVQNRKTIYNQIKKMGFSVDWTREKFTLDPEITKGVYTTFKKLYDDGLIYQGERILNWCPQCSTFLSDLEVSYKEKEGTLYYIKYPIKGSKKFITVATVRPETMLGDVAIAFYPGDKRYKDLEGKKAILPLLNREIPILTDKFVDPTFGTGAVKITPAHDPNDFEVGLRHKLTPISVIGQDDKMTAMAGEFKGVSKYTARKQIIEQLAKLKLLAKEEKMTHRVGFCERSDTRIEPLVSKQWFIKIQPLALPALKAVQKGEIQILPKRFAKVYFNWMLNIHDWNISRQIWWGHRLPVYYCGEKTNSKCQKANGIFVSVETPKVCPHCKSNPPAGGFTQDPDTLDTWFSSGQWPFTTLGWPEETADFKYFYPTTVMETGYDILFFWVARMIMLGIYATSKVPFKTVYLHGLIRDQKGQKMSKSKGNVIDPLVVAEKYGADAVRMALVFNSTPGNDVNLGEDKIKGMRNFTNKLWNIGRFIMDMKPDKINSQPQLSTEDGLIIAKTEEVKKQVNTALESYRFSDGAQILYDFIWHEFADHYIEYAKTRRSETQKTLEEVFRTSLELLHPFMPFITEELWQRLPHTGKSLMISNWPK